MQTICELVFLNNLISSILYNIAVPDIPDNINWGAFVEIVRKNSFSGLIYKKLEEIPNVPEKVLASLKKKYEENVHRSLQQEYFTEQILDCFEKNEIKCLPLKGIVLRKLYPDPTMRSMSDLDILIDTDKLSLTRELMKKLGFEVLHFDSHHDVYRGWPNINVELHKMLIVGEMEDYFGVGFEKAFLKEGSAYTYELSKEDFYIHMIGHMAYHFATGGVGIRLVLDIRVYLDKYGECLDRVYLSEQLKEAGLYTFAGYVERLAAVWFKGEPSDSFLDELGLYILKSGYLGNKEHREILEVVKQYSGAGNKKAKRKAIIADIFPPFQTMAFLYPILKKVPVLLPVCWAARWIEVWTTRRGNVSRLRRLSEIDEKEIQELDRLYDELGMKHLL